MQIIIKLKEKEYIFDLADNKTSKDLYKQLPLEVNIEDYAGLEKIFYPPNKLSTLGAPKGYKPSKGDITYYAPWGDIAIFYKDFSYAKGLIYLGKMQSFDESLISIENTKVLIEKND